MAVLWRESELAIGGFVLSSSPPMLSQKSSEYFHQIDLPRALEILTRNTHRAHVDQGFEEGTVEELVAQVVEVAADAAGP